MTCMSHCLSEFAADLLQNGRPIPRNGSKTDQAHPPIHPTKHSTNLNVSAILILSSSSLCLFYNIVFWSNHFKKGQREARLWVHRAALSRLLFARRSRLRDDGHHWNQRRKGANANILLYIIYQHAHVSSYLLITLTVLHVRFDDHRAQLPGSLPIREVERQGDSQRAVWISSFLLSYNWCS